MTKEEEIPSEIVKESDWYSIVESDWGKVTDIHGKEVDDKLIEIYLLKLGRVIRVWSTGSLVADDYVCDDEQCREGQEESARRRDNE